MAQAIEILVNVEQAKQYIQTKRDMLIDVIAGRVDVVNQMFADRVRSNLSGGVLQSQSGNLLGTVQQTPAVISGNEIVAAVQAGGDSAPYGVYFEEGGSGYYEIVPVNARVLAFMGEGGMIFAKFVNHPPIPHLPWFGIEVPQAEDDMTTQINAAFGEVLDK